ncbi:hypothetical protein V6N12_045780 [Hibiscus sabdariffa]|uniref:Uncharacterized protein n=1 Tax=Hibiscus sabdariffa TaxID=183260 RepID=A0ABR2G3T1_9ROSI
MADIALLMAKLQCSEEDLDGMDPIQFEEDHHVEGSDKWLVRKCSLLPEGDVPEFQYGSWLKVETTRPNQDKAKKLRTGIVFTKPVEPAMVRERSALAISTQNGDRGKGEVRAHPIQKARSGYMGVRIVKAYTWAPRRLEVFSEAKIDVCLPLGPFHGCHDWLQQVIDVVDPDIFILLVMLLWNMWNRRNKWTHDAKLVPARILVENTQTLLLDLAAARSIPLHHPPHTRSLIWSCVHSAETTEACAFARGIDMAVVNNWPNVIIE